MNLQRLQYKVLLSGTNSGTLFVVQALTNTGCDCILKAYIFKPSLAQWNEALEVLNIISLLWDQFY